MSLSPGAIVTVPSHEGKTVSIGEAIDGIVSDCIERSGFDAIANTTCVHDRLIRDLCFECDLMTVESDETIIPLDQEFKISREAIDRYGRHVIRAMIAAKLGMN